LDFREIAFGGIRRESGAVESQSQIPKIEIRNEGEKLLIGTRIPKQPGQNEKNGSVDLGTDGM
jgi:hypothetical protein